MNIFIQAKFILIFLLIVFYTACSTKDPKYTVQKLSNAELLGINSYLMTVELLKKKSLFSDTVYYRFTDKGQSYETPYIVYYPVEYFGNQCIARTPLDSNYYSIDFIFLIENSGIRRWLHKTSRIDFDEQLMNMEFKKDSFQVYLNELIELIGNPQHQSRVTSSIFPSTPLISSPYTKWEFAADSFWSVESIHIHDFTSSVIIRFKYSS